MSRIAKIDRPHWLANRSGDTRQPLPNTRTGPKPGRFTDYAEIMLTTLGHNVSPIRDPCTVQGFGTFEEHPWHHIFTTTFAADFSPYDPTSWTDAPRFVDCRMVSTFYELALHLTPGQKVDQLLSTLYTEQGGPDIIWNHLDQNAVRSLEARLRRSFGTGPPPFHPEHPWNRPSSRTETVWSDRWETVTVDNQQEHDRFEERRRRLSVEFAAHWGDQAVNPWTTTPPALSSLFEHPRDRVNPMQALHDWFATALNCIEQVHGSQGVQLYLKWRFTDRNPLSINMEARLRWTFLSPLLRAGESGVYECLDGLDLSEVKQTPSAKLWAAWHSTVIRVSCTSDKMRNKYIELVVGTSSPLADLIREKIWGAARAKITCGFCHLHGHGYSECTRGAPSLYTAGVVRGKPSCHYITNRSAAPRNVVASEEELNLYMKEMQVLDLDRKLLLKQRDFDMLSRQKVDVRGTRYQQLDALVNAGKKQRRESWGLLKQARIQLMLKNPNSCMVHPPAVLTVKGPLYAKTHMGPYPTASDAAAFVTANPPSGSVRGAHSDRGRHDRHRSSRESSASTTRHTSSRRERGTSRSSKSHRGRFDDQPNDDYRRSERSDYEEDYRRRPPRYSYRRDYRRADRRRYFYERGPSYYGYEDSDSSYGRDTDRSYSRAPPMRARTPPWSGSDAESGPQSPAKRDRRGRARGRRRKESHSSRTKPTTSLAADDDTAVDADPVAEQSWTDIDRNPRMSSSSRKRSSSRDVDTDHHDSHTMTGSQAAVRDFVESPEEPRIDVGPQDIPDTAPLPPESKGDDAVDPPFEDASIPFPADSRGSRSKKVPRGGGADKSRRSASRERRGDSAGRGGHHGSGRGDHGAGRGRGSGRGGRGAGRGSRRGGRGAGRGGRSGRGGRGGGAGGFGSGRPYNSRRADRRAGIYDQQPYFAREQMANYSGDWTKSMEMTVLSDPRDHYDEEGNRRRWCQGDTPGVTLDGYGNRDRLSDFSEWMLVYHPWTALSSKDSRTGWRARIEGGTFKEMPEHPDETMTRTQSKSSRFDRALFMDTLRTHRGNGSSHEEAYTMARLVVWEQYKQALETGNPDTFSPNKDGHNMWGESLADPLQSLFGEWHYRDDIAFIIGDPRGIREEPGDKVTGANCMGNVPRFVPPVDQPDLLPTRERADIPCYRCGNLGHMQRGCPCPWSVAEAKRMGWWRDPVPSSYLRAARRNSELRRASNQQRARPRYTLNADNSSSNDSAPRRNYWTQSPMRSSKDVYGPPAAVPITKKMRKTGHFHAEEGGQVFEVMFYWLRQQDRGKTLFSGRGLRRLSTGNMQRPFMRIHVLDVLPTLTVRDVKAALTLLGDHGPVWKLLSMGNTTITLHNGRAYHPLVCKSEQRDYVRIDLDLSFLIDYMRQRTGNCDTQIGHIPPQQLQAMRPLDRCLEKLVEQLEGVKSETVKTLLGITFHSTQFFTVDNFGNKRLNYYMFTAARCDPSADHDTEMQLFKARLCGAYGWTQADCVVLRHDTSKLSPTLRNQIGGRVLLVKIKMGVATLDVCWQADIDTEMVWRVYDSKGALSARLYPADQSVPEEKDLKAIALRHYGSDTLHSLSLALQQTNDEVQVVYGDDGMTVRHASPPPAADSKMSEDNGDEEDTKMGDSAMALDDRSVNNTTTDMFDPNGGQIKMGNLSFPREGTRSEYHHYELKEQQQEIMQLDDIKKDESIDNSSDRVIGKLFSAPSVAPAEIERFSVEDIPDFTTVSKKTPSLNAQGLAAKHRHYTAWHALLQQPLERARNRVKRGETVSLPDDVLNGTIEWYSYSIDEWGSGAHSHPKHWHKCMQRISSCRSNTARRDGMYFFCMHLVCGSLAEDRAHFCNDCANQYIELRSERGRQIRHPADWPVSPTKAVAELSWIHNPNRKKRTKQMTDKLVELHYKQRVQWMHMRLAQRVASEARFASSAPKSEHFWHCGRCDIAGYQQWAIKFGADRSFARCKKLLKRTRWGDRSPWDLPNPHHDGITHPLCRFPPSTWTKTQMHWDKVVQKHFQPPEAVDTEGIYAVYLSIRTAKAEADKKRRDLQKALKEVAIAAERSHQQHIAASEAADGAVDGQMDQDEKEEVEEIQLQDGAHETPMGPIGDEFNFDDSDIEANDENAVDNRTLQSADTDKKSSSVSAVMVASDPVNAAQSTVTRPLQSSTVSNVVASTSDAVSGTSVSGSSAPLQPVSEGALQATAEMAPATTPPPSSKEPQRTLDEVIDSATTALTSPIPFGGRGVLQPLESGSAALGALPSHSAVNLAADGTNELQRQGAVADLGDAAAALSELQGDELKSHLPSLDKGFKTPNVQRNVESADAGPSPLGTNPSTRHYSGKRRPDDLAPGGTPAGRGNRIEDEHAESGLESDDDLGQDAKANKAKRRRKDSESPSK